MWNQVVQKGAALPLWAWGAAAFALLVLLLMCLNIQESPPPAVPALPALPAAAPVVQQTVKSAGESANHAIGKGAKIVDKLVDTAGVAVDTAGVAMDTGAEVVDTGSQFLKGGTRAIRSFLEKKSTTEPAPQ